MASGCNHPTGEIAQSVLYRLKYILLDRLGHSAVIVPVISNESTAHEISIALRRAWRTIREWKGYTHHL
jgi:hypothetical protein